MRDWTIPTALYLAKARATGDRFVLALIAGHWNPTTRDARPGTRRLAELSGSSRSTVGRRIAHLLALGDLVVSVPGKGTRPTSYKIPSLDDGPLATRVDGSLSGLATRPGGDAMEGPDPCDASRGDARVPGDSASDPFSSSSDPLVTRPTRAESRKGELVPTRARAREDNPVRAIRDRLVSPPLRS